MARNTPTIPRPPMSKRKISTPSINSSIKACKSVIHTTKVACPRKFVQLSNGFAA
jgi:hypothetical protein